MPNLNDIIEHRFSHHTPTETQLRDLESFQRYFLIVAKEIVSICPNNADRTHALRVLLDAKMWVNASIMLDIPSSD